MRSRLLGLPILKTPRDLMGSELAALVPPMEPSTGPTRTCKGLLSVRESASGIGRKVGINDRTQPVWGMDTCLESPAY